MRKFKLSDDAVAAIRARYTRRTAGRPRLGAEGARAGSKRQLAAEYGVSPTLIGYIVSGERRKLARPLGLTPVEVETAAPAAAPAGE